jgi:hypothetical protein
VAHSGEDGSAAYTVSLPLTAGGIWNVTVSLRGFGGATGAAVLPTPSLVAVQPAPLDPTATVAFGPGLTPIAGRGLNSSTSQLTLSLFGH